MDKAKRLNKNIAARLKAKQKQIKVAVMAPKKNPSLLEKILNWFR
jgi:hypothetical protein